jgi:hypothetical protein
LPWWFPLSLSTLQTCKIDLPLVRTTPGVAKTLPGSRAILVESTNRDKTRSRAIVQNSFGKLASEAPADADEVAIHLDPLVL